MKEKQQEMDDYHQKRKAIIKEMLFSQDSGDKISKPSRLSPVPCIKEKQAPKQVSPILHDSAQKNQFISQRSKVHKNEFKNNQH